MKKNLSLTIIIITTILAFSAFVSASAVFPGNNNLNEGSSTEPYYVYTDSLQVRGQTELRHDFGNVFSADLTKGQLKAIQALGIKTEPVGIFTIIEATQCRNDNQCSDGYYCDKTDAVRGMGVCVPIENGGEEPEPETRSCYPTTQTPWGINKVNGGSGGNGIKVAVLDTGVMQEHLDLKNRIVACETKVTRFNPDRKDCEDGHGHGTHVAGTVLADAGSDGWGIYGVAPEAQLIAVKVCDRRGSCYGDDIAAGINYAVTAGANIISMSLGGSSLSSLEKNAIDNAVSQGVLVVAAAGNSGPNLNTINYPAAYHKVVSVAAIDVNDRVPDFSSRGINADEFVAGQDRYMELAAPGVSVYSTLNNGCYGTASGTSMAAPHVSGLAAKLWQQDAVTTRNYLQNLAQGHDITQGHHASEGYDPASGFGLPVATS